MLGEPRTAASLRRERIHSVSFSDPPDGFEYLRLKLTTCDRIRMLGADALPRDSGKCMVGMFWPLEMSTSGNVVRSVCSPKESIAKAAVMYPQRT